jgi:hypothetical protein
VRIEILLDLRADEGTFPHCPWQIFMDGRRTEPPLTTIGEVIECLMRLGADPGEAQRYASSVSRTSPYCQFDLPGKG